MAVLFLLLSIAASCYIVLYFKYIERYKLELLPIIITNYWVCVICGAIHSPQFFTNIIHSEKNVVPLAIVLGILFISVFFLMGTLTQKIGAGFVAILTKMSVMIPIIFSLFYLGETLTAMQTVGILFALLALLLIQYPKKETLKTEKTPFSFTKILPALFVFTGSGAIDTLLKVYDVNFSRYIANSSDFLVFLFGTAGLIGTIVGIFLAFSGKMKVSKKEIFAGICLGVPNYLSILFLLKALSYMEGSIFFPLNNVSIVMTVCLVGILFFKETYSQINYIGIGLALGAIILMAV